MMRWIVFFLVILNMLIFIWFSFQDDQSNQLEENNSALVDFSAVEAISLLTELPTESLDSKDNRRDPASDPRNESFNSTNYCAIVGPFSEVISAKQFMARLSERALPSELVSIMQELAVTNWVYIAPQTDRKKALAILKDLQEKNIDSFLITDGDYANGISLGSFSSLDSANAVLAERKEQGYPVSLAVKSRQQKTYWLRFNSEVSSKIDLESLRSLTDGGVAIKKQEKTCAEVALLEIIE